MTTEYEWAVIWQGTQTMSCGTCYTLEAAMQQAKAEHLAQGEGRYYTHIGWTEPFTGDGGGVCEYVLRFTDGKWVME